ncbi:MAG: DUF4276 family protein [Deltaproteobacteria bacterium]|nr:DUF4276 family protein [Deltaproteobacteria bacterium]
MGTYGIVIEGQYDEVALTEIIKKCFSMEVEIIPRKCGGKDKLITRFPAYLESFRYEKKGSHVDKAIVIRDAHGEDPEKIKEIMRGKIEKRNYPFKVKFIIIAQELEAWLLADEEAISRVTVDRSGKPVPRVNESLESIPQPKQTLHKILGEARVAYTDGVAREIAKESDLDKIEYRCPRFREFRQTVIDC